MPPGRLAAFHQCPFQEACPPGGFFNVPGRLAPGGFINVLFINVPGRLAPRKACPPDNPQYLALRKACSWSFTVTSISSMSSTAAEISAEVSPWPPDVQHSSWAAPHPRAFPRRRLLRRNRVSLQRHQGIRMTRCAPTDAEACYSRSLSGSLPTSGFQLQGELPRN